uniref:Uncharacterized protein n=1 Tax=Arundo donax TaxID=35708 RepID=A0A0A9BLI7_ARUDO
MIRKLSLTMFALILKLNKSESIKIIKVTLF